MGVIAQEIERFPEVISEDENGINQTMEQWLVHLLKLLKSNPN